MAKIAPIFSNFIVKPAEPVSKLQATSRAELQSSVSASTAAINVHTNNTHNLQPLHEHPQLQPATPESENSMSDFSGFSHIYNESYPPKSPIEAPIHLRDEIPNHLHSGLKPQNTQMVKNEFPWLKDESLILALHEMSQIQFSQEEQNYIQQMGINPPFKSGFEALHFIKSSNIRIIFDKMNSETTHAEYDFEQNLIRINPKYKNTSNIAEVLAISEAILHESGHAKDNDGENSVQEELNSLSLNVLAHRYYLRKYPLIFNNSDAPIVKDGVNLYEKLFFSPDKKPLVERVKDKYGDLPEGDLKHSPSELALMVKGLFKNVN